MSKRRVAVFTASNCKLLTMPDPSAYVGVTGAVVDPDLSAVQGEKPHYWKLCPDGTIVPMDSSERAARDALIDETPPTPQVMERVVYKDKEVVIDRPVNVYVDRIVETVKEVIKEVAAEPIVITKEIERIVYKDAPLTDDSIRFVDRIKVVERLPNWVIPSLVASAVAVIGLLLSKLI